MKLFKIIICVQKFDKCKHLDFNQQIYCDDKIKYLPKLSDGSLNVIIKENPKCKDNCDHTYIDF